MDKEVKFSDVIIAVSATGEQYFVSAPQELIDYMDGDLVSDNASWDTIDMYPTEPGVYMLDCTYQFIQGYYEGYPHDGESWWDFIPENIRVLRAAEWEAYEPKSKKKRCYMDRHENIDLLLEELTKSWSKADWEETPEDDLRYHLGEYLDATRDDLDDLLLSVYNFEQYMGW